MMIRLHLHYGIYRQSGLAFCFMLLFFMLSCKPTIKDTETHQKNRITAEALLASPEYPAISYGGYRLSSRDQQPSMTDLKEDMVLLHAMGVRMLRTYNVHLAQAKNLLQAISELKSEQEDFEMYVMLGAWIDCKNAWTDQPPIHDQESERNATEIATAVDLAQQYADIVKIIAVGNEAMVKWATAYYVSPSIILKWVNHLQELKANGILDKELWITSSDNFASWGGGTPDYHTAALDSLIRSVDYLSVHTYPMHDTHYNPQFWGYPKEADSLSKAKKVEIAMVAAAEYAKTQYQNVKSYLDSIGIDKPIHIGETGWASSSDGFYGREGSRACDEYKQALYYHAMRSWTVKDSISCFFFEAFDESWKDAGNPKGSENHFGLFTIDGKAKYALWPLVDEGRFKDLKRGGSSIRKSYDGNLDALMQEVMIPPIRR